jgi:hypothetical protein
MMEWASKAGLVCGIQWCLVGSFGLRVVTLSSSSTKERPWVLRDASVDGGGVCSDEWKLDVLEADTGRGP